VRKASNEIHGKAEIVQYEAIRDVFDEAVVTAIAAYGEGKKVDQRLVEYAKECVRMRYAHYKGSGLFEFAEEFVRIIRDGE
jgi:predicted ThiF/HesA family dinucleotide-utilizing enzyme